MSEGIKIIPAKQKWCPYRYMLAAYPLWRKNSSWNRGLRFYPFIEKSYTSSLVGFQSPNPQVFSIDGDA